MSELITPTPIDSSHITKDLDHIFYPKSIAVLGTNRVVGTVPHDIFANILKTNFQGTIYPVSPKEKSIMGVKAYKYVLDVPDPVDMAVIVFAGNVCHLALDQCGQKGVKSAIIISAGFREVGPAGVQREEQLKEIAAKYHISFIGPNCLGVINTDPTTLLNASFARQMPIEGNIAFLSQSGALCTAVLDYAQAKNIGFSKFVSFGNKADINEIDLMYYLENDSKTKVILIYLEEMNNGTAFIKAAKEIIRESGKPILVIKAGRTTEGAAAAASHTGSLAGSDEICDAALRQAGVIRCTTIEEMFNYAIALTYQPLPKTNRVAIITNAGGPGVLATDAAIAENLSLAKFSEATREKFKAALPATANIKNPVDVIGDARADRYRVALSGALEDDNVDGALVILTPQSMTDIDSIANEVCTISSQYNKPTYASFMGESDVASGIKILQRHHIPHYILPESMCKSFAAAYHYAQQLMHPADDIVSFTDIKKEAARTIIENAVAAKRSYLPEEESVKILSAYGLPLLLSGLAGSRDEAVSIAKRIGFPVVMKIVSDDVIHKSEVGGVIIGINNEEDSAAAYERIRSNIAAANPKAVIKGIYVVKMAPKGTEIILGIKRDSSFGPVVMFGLGGIFVEIFKDVSFRVAPIGKLTAEEMIRDVKSYKILAGARGRKPSDVSSIETAIQRLSQLAIDFPQIKELDINPLIVGEEGNGCFVADARILL
jgi:acetyl coenzyme A synthetase (ADP forming)-like protein